VKILMIVTKTPYPATSGGAILIYNTIKYLALRGHNITLVSITDGAREDTELKKWCRWVPVQKDTRTSFKGLFFNLFSKTPYTISKYCTDRVKKKIEKLLEENDFDVVHIEQLHLAYYGLFVKKRFKLPVVLRQENVETEIMERFYKNCRNPFVKAYAYLQYRKIYAYESKICEIFDECLMITKKDVERIKTMSPKVKATMVPAGVDVSYFSPIGIAEEPYSVVSVASMDWLPNVEGILWFYKDVFPLVKERISKAKLYIIGRNPPPNIRKIESKDVIVTGFVEDVREYMAKGQVFVVPLKTGSGMRIKILNALAMGRPIVSTLVGCEGINVTDGRDISIADTPENFAQKVVALLDDGSKRRKMGREGIKLVRERYRWEQIVEQIESEYVKMLADGR